jgi:ribonuclease HI
MKTLYTDGACSGNPGPGGWAWVDVDGPWASGCENPSTNQRMEITAALEALRAHPRGEVKIVSDSTYVVNCFRDKWWDGWMRRGWLNAAKKPVANRDLWEPLINLYLARSEEVTFGWVKGHGTDLMNAKADLLAVEASLTQRPASG